MRVFGTCLLLLCVLWPAAASAAPFKEVDAGATGAPVASPAGEFVAYLARPGKVLVRGEPGGVSERDVPEECIPAAASTHSVALDCYDASGNPDSILVDDFVTGDKTRVTAGDLPQDGPVGALGKLRAIDVGRHWLHLRASGAPGAGGHELTDEFLVDLDDKRAIDLADDPYGARKVFNLNRTPPARRACKPARRHRGGGTAFNEARFGVARGFGPWVLAAESDIEWELTNCRSNRQRTIRAEGPLLLNANHLATVQISGDVYEVVLTRLKPRRVQRFEMGAVAGVAPQVALSKGVLWVLTGAGEVLKRKL